MTEKRRGLGKGVQLDWLGLTHELTNGGTDTRISQGLQMSEVHGRAVIPLRNR